MLSQLVIRCLILVTDSIARRGRPAGQRDAGASTLEMVVLALGGIAMATMAVAAMRQGVLNRLNPLK